MRAVDAANADVVFSASYPPDAVGMVRAANEIGLKAKMFGGGLVGLQYASIKQQLGPQLNGIINYDFWEPAKTLEFPRRRGIPEEIPGQGGQRRRRSARLLPAAFRLCQFAGAAGGGRGRRRASTRTSSPTGCAKTRSRQSSAIIEFGSNGEWKEARVLQVQFHDVKGSDLDQWKTDEKQTILWPDKYATGKAVYPYSEAKK